MIADNADEVAAAVGDLRDFSRDLKQLSGELRTVVSTNAAGVERVVKNVEAASVVAQELLTDLKAGNGLVGSLLRDDQLRQEGAVLVSNLSIASSNLVILSSNLSRYGIFYKPRKPSVPAESLYPGRTPFK